MVASEVRGAGSGYEPDEDEVYKENWGVVSIPFRIFLHKILRTDLAHAPHFDGVMCMGILEERLARR